MVGNIYQKSIDLNNLGNKQRVKSNTIMGKKNKENIIGGQEKLVQEGALTDSDRELLVILKNYINDILENTYNAIINEVFSQIKEGRDENSAEFDNFHFFKFSTFMIEVQRLKAQEEQQMKQKEAFEEAK